MLLLQFPLLCFPGYNLEIPDRIVAFTVSIDMIAAFKSELFVQFQACGIVSPDFINDDLVTEPGSFLT